MDQRPILQHASLSGIEWIFSPPKASHYGGAWERLIRSTRKILLAVSCESKRNMSVEELCTLFCEAEFILNSRPLTPVSAESVDLGPITPNHLLLGSTCPSTVPSTVDSNLHYARKRWKFSQKLADTFWKRWRREYLPTIRLRPKWLKQRRNFQVGDMVLVVNGDTPRGSWPFGVGDSVSPSRDGVVRKANIRLVRSSSSSKQLPTTTILQRPVHKLVLVNRWAELEGKK